MYRYLYPYTQEYQRGVKVVDNKLVRRPDVTQDMFRADLHTVWVRMTKKRAKELDRLNDWYIVRTPEDHIWYRDCVVKCSQEAYESNIVTRTIYQQIVDVYNKLKEDKNKNNAEWISSGREPWPDSEWECILKARLDTLGHDLSFTHNVGYYICRAIIDEAILEHINYIACCQC